MTKSVKTATTARRVLTASMALALAAASFCASGCTDTGGAPGQASAPPTTGSGPNVVKIPQDARRIAEGTGSRLPYRPLRDGTIYVQDRTTGAVVYSGPVRAYSNVVVDPEADAVTVNDQQVKHAPKLQTGHTYRLYFVQQ